MIVSDIMSAPVYAAAGTDTVGYARNLMFKHKVSRVLIIDGHDLIGIVSRKDLGYSLKQNEPVWRRRSSEGTSLASLMTCNPQCVSPDAGVRDAVTIMLKQGISGMPVVDQGMVVGIITKTDVIYSSLIDLVNSSVKKLMKKPVTVNRGHSLDHVVDLMRESGTCLLVTNGDDGLPAGVISEKNLAFFDYNKENLSGDQHWCAADVMASPVIRIDMNKTASDVVHLMREHKVMCVCIVKGGAVKGIITRDNIIRRVIQ